MGVWWNYGNLLQQPNTNYMAVFDFKDRHILYHDEAFHTEMDTAELHVAATTINKTETIDPIKKINRTSSNSITDIDSDGNYISHKSFVNTDHPITGKALQVDFYKGC